MGAVPGQLLTTEQAESELVAWAANHQRRDELVRAARQAGLSKNRIHTITRIARTTIDRILEGTTADRDTDAKA